MTPRSIACTLLFAVALALTSESALAEPRDPAAARELAKQGYELKQQKSWEAARQKFEESLRLDPQPKHLINLADCEAELGKLGDAQRHLVEARDSALRGGADTELAGIATTRLAAVEKRMPRLTVHLAANAPKNTVVARDGVTLQGPSLDVALPTDPGKHVIVVRADGRSEQTFEVALAEGESKTLEVAPGLELVAPPPAAKPKPIEGEPPNEGGSPLRTVGVITGVVGVIGLGIGTGFFLSARGKKDSAACDGNVCASEANAEEYRAAKRDANAATLFYVAGGIVTVAGAAMFFLAPSGKRTGSNGPIRIGISVDRVVLTGRF